ncbi:MAG: flavodoxin family protein [Dorea sp.]
MKIMVLCGSPHKNGTTNELADAFIKGAVGAGYEVKKIWLKEKEISPCLGCMYCKKNDGICIQKDDVRGILDDVVEADTVVFVSPLYYFAMTAQLKMLIDRFFAVNGLLRKQKKKAVLLTAGSDSDEWAMDGVKSHYETMLKYLHWTSVGEIYAYGCTTKEMLEKTDYLEKAEVLGESIR